MDLSYDEYQVEIDGRICWVHAQSLGDAMQKVSVLRLDEEYGVITFYGRQTEKGDPK